MKRRKTLPRWGCGLMLVSLGCGGEADPCVEGEACQLEGEVQVATWWGTRGELYIPFDILKQSLRRTTGLEATLAHRLQTKTEHTRWIEGQLEQTADPLVPLDVFSANNGDEVLRWTRCAASGIPPESPRLVGLTNGELGVSALDPGWIAENFPREVMQTLQCEGETYALPVGIHRINTLLYNKESFRKAGYAVDGAEGLPLPGSLEELSQAARAIDATLPEEDAGSDLPASVFAVAGREAWTLSLFVIENLMLSLAQDSTHYQNYWQGRDCDEGLLERTLAEFEKLRPWFGNWELSASEALARVTSGQAAMMVMGDWAAAEPAPEDVGTIPFPGTAQYFVFSADVFALPDIPNADPLKGLAWLRAVTGDETQHEFSIAKSALPARTDLEGELAPGGGSAPEWVRSLPAIFPYVENGPFHDLQDVLKEWLYARKDTGSVLEYAREEYSKLSHGTVSCVPTNVDGRIPE
ncbi:MAG TPA: ABC transporter substrate-binding protein [Polyangiaceae bacterium]|nr:ABC transporter substrate-binding protein [Polyangiaceae bacterium]